MLNALTFALPRAQIEASLTNIAAIKNPTTKLNFNKPYAEVLGAAQLTKRIKACKSM